MIDVDVLIRIGHRFGDGAEGVYEAILSELPERQEEEPTARATQMDTLGSLVDKLCTVSMKMWHNQEHLYAIRRMTKDEFCALYGDRLEHLHDIVRRCCDLNVQRASLMDEIDKFLRDAVQGSKTDLVREQHKTY